MDDLIKRSEAIDAIRQWVKMNQYYHPFSKGKTIPVDEAIDQLERVQAEQPSSQKTGTWLVANGACEPDYMECNHCGWITEYYGGLEEEWNYCPYCGAKMESE